MNGRGPARMASHLARCLGSRCRCRRCHPSLSHGNVSDHATRRLRGARLRITLPALPSRNPAAATIGEYKRAPGLDVMPEQTRRHYDHYQLGIRCSEMADDCETLLAAKNQFTCWPSREMTDAEWKVSSLYMAYFEEMTGTQGSAAANPANGLCFVSVCVLLNK